MHVLGRTFYFAQFSIEKPRFVHQLHVKLSGTADPYAVCLSERHLFDEIYDFEGCFSTLQQKSDPISRIIAGAKKEFLLSTIIPPNKNKNLAFKVKNLPSIRIFHLGCINLPGLRKK
jgi:hypothetical protein